MWIVIYEVVRSYIPKERPGTSNVDGLPECSCGCIFSRQVIQGTKRIAIVVFRFWQTEALVVHVISFMPIKNEFGHCQIGCDRSASLVEQTWHVVVLHEGSGAREALGGELLRGDAGTQHLLGRAHGGDDTALLGGEGLDTLRVGGRLGLE